MSRPDKYVRVYDERTKTLHVYPRGTPIPMSRSGIIQPHPKAADLDQIFGRKPPRAREVGELGGRKFYAEEPDAEKPS